MTREQHRTVTDDAVGLTWHRRVPDGASARHDVPVVLHHGFVSSTTGDWENTGIVAALLEAGRVVVGIVARGHGRSDSPHDPAHYGEARMAGLPGDGRHPAPGVRPRRLLGGRDRGAARRGVRHLAEPSHRTEQLNHPSPVGR